MRNLLFLAPLAAALNTERAQHGPLISLAVVDTSALGDDLLGDSESAEGCHGEEEFEVLDDHDAFTEVVEEDDDDDDDDDAEDEPHALSHTSIGHRKV